VHNMESNIASILDYIIDYADNLPTVTQIETLGYTYTSGNSDLKLQDSAFLDGQKVPYNLAVYMSFLAKDSAYRDMKNRIFYSLGVSSEEATDIFAALNTEVKFSF
jgi:hypothetical protein